MKMMKNKKRINKITACVFVLSIYPIYFFSQSIEKKYDLGFRSPNSCEWRWVYRCSSCSFSLDATVLREGKHPLKISYSPLKLRKDNMGFVMSRTIVLPEHQKGNNCRVSLDCMMQNASNFKFITSAIGKDETVIKSDTLLIKDTEWGIKTISIPLVRAKAIQVQLIYAGNNSLNQHIWLNKIAIDIDGKDITHKLCSSHSSNDSLRIIERFDKSRIYPLSETDNSALLDGIQDFNDKKIIGLGSSVQGSHEVNEAMVEFAKHLISKQNAKLILLEIPFDMSAVYDIYAQGIVSTDVEKNIEEGLRSIFVDYRMYMDFLRWIRKYNETVPRKVHVLGIDADISPFSNTFLYEYFYTLLGKDKGAYYLDLIKKGRNQKLIELAKVDQPLKEILGEENYKLLMHFLYSYTPTSRSMDHYGASDIDREWIMVNQLLNIARYFQNGEEKCVILAHHSHLAKVESLSNSKLTIGDLLASKEKHNSRNKYLAISFQVGKGTICRQGCKEQDAISLDTLETPPYNSFENIGLSTGIDCFYYPTKYLSDDVLQISSISRSVNNDGCSYMFASPKRRFDAIVFIRDSTPLRNVDLNQ